MVRDERQERELAEAEERRRRLRIPDRIPLERSICELEGRAPAPLVPEPEISSMIMRCEQASSMPLGELNGGLLRLLIGQGEGLPWVLRPALGLVAQDPLASHTFYEGDLLQQLISSFFDEDWAANPEDAETIRRACARVEQLAHDPDPDVADMARRAIETFEDRPGWPWVPPEQLDRPERWRMPDSAPVARSVDQLAERTGLQPMRPEDELTARLRPACARPLGELTREQLRLLIQEHEGLPWVLPQALHLVEEDPLELTARHPGGLLIALLDIRFAVVWRHNPELVARLRQVLADLERAAVDPDPARAQAPLALLQRLEERKLYPWHPKPTG